MTSSSSESIRRTSAPLAAGSWCVRQRAGLRGGGLRERCRQFPQPEVRTLPPLSTPLSAAAKQNTKSLFNCEKKGAIGPC